MAKTDEKGAKKVLRSIHEVMKGLKEEQKALGPRKLSPEGKRKRALGAFTVALERRPWNKISTGRYKMGNHTVRMTSEHYVVVDEDLRLDLGDGAIAALDDYVKTMARQA